MNEDFTKNKKKMKKRAPSSTDFDDIQRIGNDPQSVPRNLPNISGNQDEEEKVIERKRTTPNNEKIMKKVQSGKLTPSQPIK